MSLLYSFILPLIVQKKKIKSKVSSSHEKLSFIIFFCAMRGGCVSSASSKVFLLLQGIRFICGLSVELSGFRFQQIKKLFAFDDARKQFFDENDWEIVCRK